MPMKRELYPSNWKTIATIIKYQANWRCEQCDRPCRRPQEKIDDFIDRLIEEDSKFYVELSDAVEDSEGNICHYPRYGRFVLTVAHLDQNPGNNARENLKALCPTCHNRHDAKARAVNRSHTLVVKKEEAGQLRIKGL